MSEAAKGTLLEKYTTQLKECTMQVNALNDQARHQREEASKIEAQGLQLMGRHQLLQELVTENGGDLDALAAGMDEQRPADASE